MREWVWVREKQLASLKETNLKAAVRTGATVQLSAEVGINRRAGMGVGLGKSTGSGSSNGGNSSAETVENRMEASLKETNLKAAVRTRARVQLSAEVGINRRAGMGVGIWREKQLWEIEWRQV